MGDGGGSVSGGNLFKDRLSALGDALSRATSVEVGFFENSTYPSGVSVPLVAAIQEFGSSSRGIPPRPFFRGMVAANVGQWPAQLATYLKASDWDAGEALDLLGLKMSTQLQASILELMAPPLKPSTIRRKGFDKPLIDTSFMLHSVTHLVL